ncbi:MAG: hypothetical protein ACRDL5_16840, partial [Solirubrobacteraceae bacterium]
FDLPNLLTLAGGGGGVTASGSMTVDDQGQVDFNGIELEANDLSLGVLNVNSICFSLVPALSNDTDQCTEPPLTDSFTGTADYLSCAPPATPPVTPHWAVGAEVSFPEETSSELALYGSGYGDTFNALMGYATGLNIPITDGVDLNTLGMGLCFGSPLMFRGDIGVGMLPVDGNNLLNVDGTVIFADSNPWTLTLGGALNVYDPLPGSGGWMQLATGQVTVSSDGSFYVNAGVNEQFAGGLFSLDGDIYGGGSPGPPASLEVGGDAKLCIGESEACAGVSAVASTIGIAGCATIEAGPFTTSWGAGYTWATAHATVMAGDCSVGDWQVAVPSASSAGSRVLTIAPGTRGIALHVIGSGAPPRVVISGPRGFRLVTPSAPLARGHDYVVIGDRADKATDVLLVAPRAGTYRITALSASEPIAGLETAPVLAPFSGHGTVTEASAGRRARHPKGRAGRRAGHSSGQSGERLLHLRYVLPTGASLALDERAGSGRRVTLEHAITARVHGRRCAGTSVHVAGGSQLCATIAFTPAPGPGGRRQIIAVVTRNGLPDTITPVASFVAPKQTLPSRPAKLQLLRTGTTVTIRWSQSSGASRYGVSAQPNSGASKSAFVSGACRAVRFTGIPKNVSVSAGVVGIRYDGARGRSRAAALKASRTRGGSSGKLLGGKLCR